MDEKYKGCNIVESVVTTPKKEIKTPKKASVENVKSHFFVRLIISALIVGVILALHYVPVLSRQTAVSEALGKVFCYDVFGRTDFGTTFFGR